MKIPDRIRYINKKFTNRLMMKIAGRKYSPIAAMRHTGRRTGKAYTIPILAGRVENGFVFALTYGDHVDWYRNILASGKSVLTWHGEVFHLSSPETLRKNGGKDTFSQPWKTLLSLMGTAEFFHMAIEV